MIYLERMPSKPLQKYIKCVWTLEYDGILPYSENDRILPDGYTEIIINYCDRLKCTIEGTSQQFLSSSFVSGPFTKYLHLEATGKIGLLGIRFWPGMMHSFLKIPMCELTNNYFDLHLIAKELSKEIEYEVLYSKTFEERFRLVDSTLIQYMTNNYSSTNMIVEVAINSIIYSNGLISIENLSSKINIGTRQLERLFHLHLGLTPKMFNRIIRFQRIFKELEAGHISNWLILALQCGYCDQSHFIKEFKQFSGMSPNNFFSGGNELTQYFTTGVRMSDFYNTDMKVV